MPSPSSRCCSRSNRSPGNAATFATATCGPAISRSTSPTPAKLQRDTGWHAAPFARANPASHPRLLGQQLGHHRRRDTACERGARHAHAGGGMKYALVNPAWSFDGSTYFGCPDPHFPLELLSAQRLLREAGHEVLLDRRLHGKADAVRGASTSLIAFAKISSSSPPHPRICSGAARSPSCGSRAVDRSASRRPRVPLEDGRSLDPHGSVTPQATLSQNRRRRGAARRARSDACRSLRTPRGR